MKEQVSQMYQETSKELLEFIDQCKSCYHVIRNISEMLRKAGFCELQEGKPRKLEAGGKYYVSRNSSSIIAFVIPSKTFSGFQVIASHSDSPSFKIKEKSEMVVDKKYTKLNVEKYGGMLCAPWFDRPLSIAGKIMVKEDHRICTRLVDVDRDLVMIPNLAIHMNRESDDGYKYNAQVDLLPILGDENTMGNLMKCIAESAGVQKENIVGSDLFLYNRQKGTFWGMNEEFIASTKLDDLQCAFASLKGFLANCENTTNIPVYAVFDNEEVGSTTKQGAASTFLQGTLRRIIASTGGNEEEYYMALASSFMLSADNAHGVHPNYVEKADPTNRPYLNDGIVIKYNANQKYTTDAVSSSIVKTICDKAKVPYQTYANRSDMAGGSTLGNISNTQVSMNTVDIGLAQLAMHSPYESAGVKDTYYFEKMAEAFYGAYIHQIDELNWEIK